MKNKTAVMLLTAGVLLGNTSVPADTLFFSDTNEKQEQTAAEKEKQVNTVDENSSFTMRFNALCPKDKNYVFSPLGLKYALAMTANGGDDKAVKAITDLLEIEDLKKFNDEANEYMDKYARDKTASFRNAVFNIYNSVWLGSENMMYRDLSKGFKNAVNHKYNGDIQIVHNNDITRKIRDWYNEKTENMVSLNINKKDFSNCVINSVSFNSVWKHIFWKGENSVFTDQNNKKNKCSFWKSDVCSFRFYEDDYIKMTAFPYYDNSLSLYIALTDEDNVDFEKYINKMEEQAGIIYIPKFKSEFYLSVKEYFKTLGIDTVFDANNTLLKNMFSDTGEKYINNSAVSDIIQKISFSINQYETMANSDISVVCIDGIPPEQSEDGVYKFKADRPFTYFVRDDETGNILFMGKYAFKENENINNF